MFSPFTTALPAREGTRSVGVAGKSATFLSKERTSIGFRLQLLVRTDVGVSPLIFLVMRRSRRDVCPKKLNSSLLHFCGIRTEPYQVTAGADIEQLGMSNG